LEVADLAQQHRLNAETIILQTAGTSRTAAKP
jgi:hypothetical protein